MGILSDRDIRWKLEPGGGLVIDPRPEIIQPTSVDLHLANGLLQPTGGEIIDPMKGIGPTHLEIRDFSVPGFFLYPKRFVLGATLEDIHVPAGLVGILMGKSTLARFGLQIESAGYVDPGWQGRLTLELMNLGENTIILRPGMAICQIRFETLFMNECDHLYGDPAVNSHYQGSQKPEPGKVDRLPVEKSETAGFVLPVSPEQG